MRTWRDFFLALGAFMLKNSCWAASTSSSSSMWLTTDIRVNASRAMPNTSSIMPDAALASVGCRLAWMFEPESTVLSSISSSSTRACDSRAARYPRSAAWRENAKSTAMALGDGAAQRQSA